MDDEEISALRRSMERTADEVARSPDWLLSIYDQNAAAEARLLGRPPPVPAFRFTLNMTFGKVESERGAPSDWTEHCRAVNHAGREELRHQFEFVSNDKSKDLLVRLDVQTDVRTSQPAPYVDLCNGLAPTVSINLQSGVGGAIQLPARVPGLIIIRGPRMYVGKIHVHATFRLVAPSKTTASGE